MLNEKKENNPFSTVSIFEVCAATIFQNAFVNELKDINDSKHAVEILGKCKFTIDSEASDRNIKEGLEKIGRSFAKQANTLTEKDVADTDTYNISVALVPEFTITRKKH